MVTDDSVVSIWFSQPRPSSALRAYCCWSEREERSRIAEVAPDGSSEGRLMIRPVESCSWMCESRPSPVCRPSRARWLIMFWVTRLRVISAPARCG